MAAMEMKSQSTCLRAKSGARRVTKVMPMPASTNTMGRMAESALGAVRRTAMCAATKATARPMGTSSVVALSASPDCTT